MIFPATEPHPFDMTTTGWVLTTLGIALVITGIIMIIVMRSASGSDGQQHTGVVTPVVSFNGPVGLVLVVLGIVCVAIPATRYLLSASPSATRASAPVVVVTSAAKSPTTITASAMLTSPPDNMSVSRKNGFTAHGNARSLGKDTIWIVDYDGGYTIDGEALVSGNAWSAGDYPLGDSTDKLPFDLTMKALLATPGCAGQLLRIEGTNSEYVSSLPAGCTIFGSVTVVVDEL